MKEPHHEEFDAGWVTLEQECHCTHYTQQSTFLSKRVSDSHVWTHADFFARYATLFFRGEFALQITCQNIKGTFTELRVEVQTDCYTFSEIVSVFSYGPEGTMKRRTRTSSPFRKLAPDFGILTSDPTGRWKFLSTGLPTMERQRGSQERRGNTWPKRIATLFQSTGKIW